MSRTTIVLTLTNFRINDVENRRVLKAKVNQVGPNGTTKFNT